MSEQFLGENFILSNDSARRLYFDYARAMPIFDYHCHLSPNQIQENYQFNNLTEIWLAGDHYKWRVMRTLGISERLITGDANNYEKFLAWAEVVPSLLRSPLYHWTHMELKKPFGINELLSGRNAEKVYKECNILLSTEEFRVKGLLDLFKVRGICTTDDPCDGLVAHKLIQNDSSFETIVVPTFRPDKLLLVEDPFEYNLYLDKLSLTVGFEIRNYSELLEAVDLRHKHFHDHGCRISDHGIQELYAEEFTERSMVAVFDQIRSGKSVNPEELRSYKSGILYDFAVMDDSRGWTQQFHLGVMRNLNTRIGNKVGPDTGFDSMGDFAMAHSLSKFLDRLDSRDQLAKTIIYNLNPVYNDLIASMIGNYQGGEIKGKLQLGTAWWFNDQLDGMSKQIAAVSNSGVLSTFVGMVTDSRSFLSYPRHDYFRRLICNIFGQDIEVGILPSDFSLIGSTIKNICFNNAARYFEIPGIRPCD